jgi:hypothetical protein
MKTNLTKSIKSRHFFFLSTLSADLGSLSAFQLSAILTPGIRITLALAAAVFAATLGYLKQTRSAEVFCVLGVMLFCAVFASTQSSILVSFNEALNRCAFFITFVILALCNYLINPVVNFVLVIAFETHPELSVIIGSILISATRGLALNVVFRILIVSTKVTNPAL